VALAVELDSCRYLLEANITLIQKKGSELLEVATPYKGIWQHTKKMNRVTMVQRAFSLKGICARRFGGIVGEAWSERKDNGFSKHYLSVRGSHLRQDAHDGFY